MGAVSGLDGTSEPSCSSIGSVVGRYSRPPTGKVSPKPLGGAQTDGPTSPENLLQRRLLVEAVDNPYMQAMIAVIGETGIRKGEALSLTWSRVDLGRRMLWVEFTKDDEPREIPLSKYAAQFLAGLVRYLNTPYVFVNSRTKKRWVNPDKPLGRAAEKVGLKVGFHDLRRFRCSHWLMQGVDVRTVQKLMGHSAISTTMRYAGYVSSHALQSIREVQATEDSQTQQATNRQRSGSKGK